ncbi:hypothetical protein BGZ65_010008 [Modicella reniformis]|uniref:Uncharacterized protein n=1 Tax=Modicella reniformis TaxID=1440133 RepID=A0A9P6MAM4_9FUNG|nr:hypothetical protein BGZ65_010008 [Modicella reniformis]
MDNDGFDEEDIEGGDVGSSAFKVPAAPSATDKTPAPQASTMGGPPAGPPRGPPRKQSASTGSGPARIVPPSNNPSSPPHTAFLPTAGQLKPRVRPPPGNKVFTPYRPPERPSQAPVMYSQTGQPAFPQSYLQQPDKSFTEKSAATSIVSQGADAASSSIRPRDGGLQKRVVAGDSNVSKSSGASGPNIPAPPSPRLHVTNIAMLQSPSSATKTLKIWAIRGGLIYLGYTAIFNCGPDASGVRGLYCKATNGIGGLPKPYVAPHYNAYLGPHVDRYVKPVIRQIHRIYLKVADPVVQSAMSAAKKHVDSAKEQVISILPYPFNPKTIVHEDSDQTTPDSQQDEHEKDVPKVERVSRQPIQESDESLNKITENPERAAEALKGDPAAKAEEIVDAVQEETENVKESVQEQETPIVESDKEQVEKAAEPLLETEEHTGQAIEETNQTDSDNEIHDGTNEYDSKNSEGDDDSADETTPEEPAHVDLTHEPTPEPGVTIEPDSESSEPSSESSSEPASEPISTEVDEQESITQPVEAGEAQAEQPSSNTAESTPEFLDSPTASSEGSEQSTLHGDLTAESVEDIAQSSENVSVEEVSEDVPAPTEEKLSDEIPAATDEPNVAASEERPLNNAQLKEHSQESLEDARSKQDYTGVDQDKEQEHQAQEKPVSEDATPEQQAAPVPEAAEHGDAPKAHDEL